MKTLLFTPLHITSIQDIYMARYQARLFRSLQSECVGMATLDADNTGKFYELLNNKEIIELKFDHFLDMRIGGRHSNGIVEPTFAAIDKAVELGCDKMIRITQDTQILDSNRMMEINRTHNSIYGGKDTCSDIRRYLAEINVVMQGEKFDFVQGNFIMASTDVWVKYYKKLPTSVRHYCDDSIFSYLAKDGGVELEFSDDKFWLHNRTRDIYYLESLLRN